MTDEDLHTHLRQNLRVCARCGYESDEEILEGFVEHVQDELDLWDDEAALEPWKAECVAALAEQREKELGWSGKNHNDLIEAAFAELAEMGLIALEDAGYTMSDGWEEVDAAREADPDALAAVFFHRQDVERAMDGGDLLLAFGAFTDGPGHEADSLDAATLTCKVLAMHGIETVWDRTIDSRIAIKPFEWRKRRYSSL